MSTMFDCCWYFGAGRWAVKSPSSRSKTIGKEGLMRISVALRLNIQLLSYEVYRTLIVRFR